MGKKGRVGGDDNIIDSLLGRASARQRFAKRFVAFPGESQQDKFTSDLIRKILVSRRISTPDGYRLKIAQDSALAEYDPSVATSPGEINTWAADPNPPPVKGVRPDTQNSRHKNSVTLGKTVIDVTDRIGLADVSWRSIFAIGVTSSVGLVVDGKFLGHEESAINLADNGYLTLFVSGADALELALKEDFPVTLQATDALALAGLGVTTRFISFTDGIVVGALGAISRRINVTDGLGLGDTKTFDVTLPLMDSLALATVCSVEANRIISPRADLIMIRTERDIVRTPWEINATDNLRMTTAREIVRDQIRLSKGADIRLGTAQQHWQTPLYAEGASGIQIAPDGIPEKQSGFEVINESLPRITLTTPFVRATDFIVTTPPVDGNLLINPQFEEGTLGWTRDQNAMVQVLPSGGPNGEPALKSTSMDGSVPYSFSMVYQKIATRPGVHYKLTFDVKRGFPSTTTFAYMVRPEDYWTPTSYSDWGYAPLDGSWRNCWGDPPYLNNKPFFEYCYGVPGQHLYQNSTALWSYVGLGVYNFNTGDVIYFANVVFEELPKDQYPDHVV